MNSGLTRRDLEKFESLGISQAFLAEGQVRRVTSVQASEVGIRFTGDLAGVLFPRIDPVTGHSVGARLRRDHPAVDQDGKPLHKYVASYGDRPRLYFAPGAREFLEDTDVAAVFVEAEKSTLAVAAAAQHEDRRLLVVGAGGCWGWRGTRGIAADTSGARVPEKGPLPDLDRIEWGDRNVTIAFDSNCATNPKVRRARQAFAEELTKRGASVRLADLSVEEGVNGPDDLIAKRGIEALFHLLDQAQPYRGKAQSPNRPSSQATALVRLVIDSGAELFHDPAGDPFLTMRVDQHVETHAVHSTTNRRLLALNFYRANGTTPNASAMSDALATLAGIAQFDGPVHSVWVRVAQEDERVYLDLADSQWRAVEVDQDGWRIVTDSPVRFRRSRGVLPLSPPVPGGSLSELRPLVNLDTDDAFVLVTACLVGALRPTGPYPLLALNGEQGTAKSTLARFCRQLIDPNVAGLRSEPREPRDLMIAATHSHLCAFDNVSRLTPWLSDGLCRLSTGGGFSTRVLYTDQDEQIFDAMRPVLLNGISEVATREDLLDRTLSVTLPVIPEERRRSEADLVRDFEQTRPRILGALLDAVSVALRREGEVELLGRLPRMADFATWVSAAEPALPWAAGKFLEVYRANRQGAVEVMLDGDPLGEFVRILVPWEGTATDLLERLNTGTKDEVKRQKGWFSRPRQVADGLRRLAPQLRHVGIEVDLTRRQPRTGRRWIRLAHTDGISPSPSSPSSPERLEGVPAGEDDADGFLAIATTILTTPEGEASMAVGDDKGVLASHPQTNKTGSGKDGEAGDAAVTLFSGASDPAHRRVEPSVLPLAQAGDTDRGDAAPEAPTSRVLI